MVNQRVLLRTLGIRSIGSLCHSGPMCANNVLVLNVYTISKYHILGSKWQNALTTTAADDNATAIRISCRAWFVIKCRFACEPQRECACACPQTFYRTKSLAHTHRCLHGRVTHDDAVYERLNGELTFDYTRMWCDITFRVDSSCAIWMRGVTRNSFMLPSSSSATRSFAAFVFVFAHFSFFICNFFIFFFFFRIKRKKILLNISNALTTHERFHRDTLRILGHTGTKRTTKENKKRCKK